MLLWRPSPVAVAIHNNKKSLGIPEASFSKTKYTMKKLLIFIPILLTLSALSQNTYVRAGVSLITKTAVLTDKVTFGGIAGHTNFGVLVETKAGDKRHWYTGVELSQDIPVAPTVDFRLGAAAKVDLAYKKHKDLFVTPQGGFNFHIAKRVSFLALYGAEFAAPSYNLKDARGTVDLGLLFRF
jgi:hypothetical protein